MAGSWAIINTAGAAIDLETIGWRVLQAYGAGMPPAKHYSQSYALHPGAQYNGRHVEPRVLTLLLGPASKPATVDLYHKARRDLEALLKPDRTIADVPFVVRYSGATTTLDINCIYEGGMEGSDAAGRIEKIALRLLAYDPFWYGTSNATDTIASSTALADVNYIAAKINGVWSKLGTGMNGAVKAIAIASNGTVYAGGEFTAAAGVANTDYIAKWNGSAWSALGTGVSGGTNVEALAIGPDGTLYAGGSFTQMGGVANTSRIAKWNGANWTALGTGAADATVYSLAIGNDGALYAGGSFTQMGGVANTAKIAKWNGSAWSALGTGMDFGVHNLAIGDDGNLYAGGFFGTAGGVSCAYIAKWNGAAWSALGAGMNGFVGALRADGAGNLYAGGVFTTAGGVTVNRVAKWNGAAWSALGAGMNSDVHDVCFISGELYAGGLFTTAGGVASTYLAVWNGSAWSPPDVKLPTAGTPSGYINCIVEDDGDIYVGMNGAGAATSAAAETVANAGTSAAYPVITIARTGGTSATLYSLRNETTGARLYFNYPLQIGETLTLDFRPGHRAITSSHYGNVWRAVLQNSDYSGFYLLPGNNTIGLFIEPAGSPTITTTLTWKPTYWSNDGGAA